MAKKTNLKKIKKYAYDNLFCFLLTILYNFKIVYYMYIIVCVFIINANN